MENHSNPQSNIQHLNNELPSSSRLHAQSAPRKRHKLMYYTVNGKCRFLLTLALLFLVNVAMAGTLTGKVVKVADGDTFTILTKDNKQQRIRMHGIDAPEKTRSQPYWLQSRDFLSELIAGKQVKVEVKSKDRYGRIVGVVSTSSCPDVNLKMLREGLAWHYSRYDNTPTYRKAHEQAKEARKGLWRDKNPVNPYEWRKKR